MCRTYITCPLARIAIMMCTPLSTSLATPGLKIRASSICHTPRSSTTLRDSFLAVISPAFLFTASSCSSSDPLPSISDVLFDKKKAQSMKHEILKDNVNHSKLRVLATLLRTAMHGSHWHVWQTLYKGRHSSLVSWAPLSALCQLFVSLPHAYMTCITC